MILTITPNTAIDRAIEVANFRVGDTTKGRVVEILPAGKGVNISRTLCTLGKPSIVSGFVGWGEEAMFEQAFAGTPAQVALVSVDEPTRFDTTIIDPVDNTVTHVRELGFNVGAGDLERLHAKLDELLPATSIVVIAGSLPPGMEPTALVSLIDHCAAGGRRVCVDTSGPALAAAAEHGCALVKPNDVELAEISGAQVNGVDAAVREARKLLDRIEIVVVSLGPEGAVCVTRDGAWCARADVPAEDVVNTVGCGDAFLAGFCAGLDDAAPMDECLRRGVACGSACALTAASGTIERATYERLCARARSAAIWSAPA